MFCSCFNLQRFLLYNSMV